MEITKDFLIPFSPNIYIFFFCTLRWIWSNNLHRSSNFAQKSNLHFQNTPRKKYPQLPPVAADLRFLWERVSHLSFNFSALTWCLVLGTDLLQWSFPQQFLPFSVRYSWCFALQVVWAAVGVLLLVQERRSELRLSLLAVVVAWIINNISRSQERGIIGQWNTLCWKFCCCNRLVPFLYWPLIKFL